MLGGAFPDDAAGDRRDLAADAAVAAAPAGSVEHDNDVAGTEGEDDASLEDAHDYQTQLDVVRRLRAAGAGIERVKAAAAHLVELKRAVYSSLPRGTASRKKKRNSLLWYRGTRRGVAAGGGDDDDDASVSVSRDAAAVARYPAPDPPPLDADGFVVAFDPPHDACDDAMVFFRRYGFVVFRGEGWVIGGGGNNSALRLKVAKPSKN